MLQRRSVLRLGLALPMGAVSLSSARAAGYPNQPIRLVVAFPPGGPSDVLGRIVGQKLTGELGQAVVVDNRPGAGGNIAAQFVAAAPADGYTLLVANNSILAANQFLYRHLSYDPIKSFAPITLIGTQPNILVVNPQLPVTSVADLIALAKAKPGTLNFASSGNGTAAHLAGELFRLRAGIDIVHVAYPGASPALTDLVAGQVQMMFATAVSCIPFIRSKMLRPLGVTTLSRSKLVPDLPTIAATLPGFAAVTWHGLVAPAKTPAPIVTQLNTAAVTALHDPGVVTHLANLGVEVVASTPQDFAAYIASDAAKWGKVIRAAHIRIG